MSIQQRDILMSLHFFNNKFKILTLFCIFSEPVSQSSYVQRVPIASTLTSIDDKETENNNQFKAVRTVKTASGGLGLVDGPKRIARPNVVKPPIADTTSETLQTMHQQSETFPSPTNEVSKSLVLIPIE